MVKPTLESMFDDDEDERRGGGERSGWSQEHQLEKRSWFETMWKIVWVDENFPVYSY